MTSTPASTSSSWHFTVRPEPAGGILGIADDQPQPPPRDETRQHLADDLAARSTDDVTDEEDFQRHVPARSFWEDLTPGDVTSLLAANRRTRLD